MNTSFHYLLRYEWLHLRRQATPWWLLGALAALLLFGAVRGGATARQQAADVRAQLLPQLAQRDSGRAVLRHHAATDTAHAAVEARSADNVGYHHVAALPKRPFAALAVGQSDLLPNCYGIGAMNKARQPEDRYGYDNPLLLLAGPFDLALVLVYLLPLAAIALSYDALAREREAGTLRLVLAQPVGLPAVLLAKLLPRAGLLLGTAAGFALLGLGLTGTPLLADGGRLALALVGLVALYGTFWLGLAACVNTLGLSSAANALVLVSGWLLLVWVLPSAIESGVGRRYPAPPRTAVVLATRARPLDFIRDVGWLAADWYRRYPDLATTTQNADSVRRSFGNGFTLVQERMDYQGAALEATIETQLGRRQRLENQLAVVSPAAVLRRQLNQLAGTDAARHHRFRAQVAAFREAWQRFFVPRSLHRVPLTAPDYERLPWFTFRELSAPAFYGDLGRGVAALAAWLGVLALGSAWGLHRLRRHL